MIGRWAPVSIAIMRRWFPHHPGRSCLFHTIRHYVTNQTNSQNAGALALQGSQATTNIGPPCPTGQSDPDAGPARPNTGAFATGWPEPSVHTGHTRSRQVGECRGHERPRG
jgi:hypothetical protein